METNSEFVEKEAVLKPPHEALFLVLAYLPVYELLTITRVCKSFMDAVNSDVLPWLHFIIDRPLSSRLTDEILLKLTSKANGRLQTLVLLNCTRITDDGLLRVVYNNPLITKLHLKGCTSLTPDGIIRVVQTLHQNGTGLKSLMINGVPNLNKHHIETLKSYLHNDTPPQNPHPILYHHYTTSPSPFIERDHSMDVDVCPRCNEVRLVFDCSREHEIPYCMGCIFCIPRCVECGGCVANDELHESACEDVLCGDCWLCLPKCNHCNKPYCTHHGNLQSSLLNSVGFVCEACHFKATTNSSLSFDAAEYEV